ncbi:unnamed protein product [Aphanomyces euteiches]|uniref:Uncharacterized protein n=1 Tax=Aphanomyces euteiches TaxID=100861 RepID=A0A6G0XLQ2_9STRA|nr:hypothetical protein Ae201684_003419 [Aphanomyces euteiches]KAH9098230.1 hypothetical protein Ae201684P_017447 [Aphanomyces euteiches]KAH9150301.1 hypothetical protein AeRB84_006823 [Aphanomyces euteiches]KAH9150557.1 hypothetical protein AeRB84_006630 [Aphanomyces euteiches]
MPQDPFGALCLLCEVGLIACFCKDKQDQVMVPQHQPVLVPQVQPAVVAASPVSQGNHVAGNYVKSPTGEVEFVPAGQSSANTQPAPSRPYNAARVPPPRSPEEAGKSPTGQALCVPAA